MQTGALRGHHGGGERVEDGGAGLFAVKVIGPDVGELVVWEGDVEGRDEEVEGLAGVVLGHGPEGGHLCLGVEGHFGGQGRGM